MVRRYISVVSIRSLTGPLLPTVGPVSCPEPSPEPPGPTLCWLRRDLRLRDHPALLAAGAEAARHAHGVAPLFVIEPRLW
ncbi:MAG: deoxyribodipyrimidine photo-lyase, partial [Nocardioides sp.]